MKIEKRDVAVSLILTIITCGIYGIYWFICLTNEVKSVSKDNELSSGGVAFLLTLITCGIYGIYWAYKMGQLMKKAQEDNKLEAKDNAILYLILEILGFGIINYALIQSDLNEMATEKTA